MVEVSRLKTEHDDTVTAAKRAVAGSPEEPGLDREMTSAYADTEDSLFPGTRKVQVRSQPEEEDPGSDSNVLVKAVAHEVTVVRSLAVFQVPSDEQIYRSEEMLYGMARLLEIDRWEALSLVDQVTSLPFVSSEPERTGNTIVYTVSFTIRLVPE